MEETRSLSLVTCGGTIAMATGTDGVLRPGDSEGVAALVRGLAPGRIVESSAGAIDSAQATTQTWAKILMAIREAVRCNPGSPVLVTHGTDTLAWSAGMAQAAGPWPVPVVFVGAMVPAGESGSDAERNVAAAVAVAAQADPGVWAVFAQGDDVDVFQGGFFRKAHLSGRTFHGAPDRFGSLVGGSLLVEVDQRAVPMMVADDTFSTAVFYLQAHPVVDRVVDAIDIGAHHFQSVVVSLYPAATCPSSMIGFARQCMDNGVAVFACGDSPVDEGGAYESLGLLADAGARLCLNSTPELLLPAVCGGWGGGVSL